MLTLGNRQLNMWGKSIFLLFYRYCADISLPNDWEHGVDAWWAMVQESGQYSELSKMALALLTCFHGPAVESNFNVMKMLMKDSMEVDTFSAVETVKYELKESARFLPGKHPENGHLAVEYYGIENFREVPPNPKLVSNMKGAYAMNEKRKKAIVQEKLERAQSLQLSKDKPITKRKAQENAFEASKKMRSETLKALAKRTVMKKKLAELRMKQL